MSNDTSGNYYLQDMYCLPCIVDDIPFPGSGGGTALVTSKLFTVVGRGNTVQLNNSEYIYNSV